MASEKKFRYHDTIGFQEVLAHISDLHPDLKEERIKEKAKTLYLNLFFSTRQGFLSLDFVCTKGHNIQTCRCTGQEFRGEWLHDTTPRVITRTWRLGVKSLVKLRPEQINHFQVQTAGHIRDFIDYISKRSSR